MRRASFLKTGMDDVAIDLVGVTVQVRRKEAKDLVAHLGAKVTQGSELAIHLDHIRLLLSNYGLERFPFLVQANLVGVSDLGRHTRLAQKPKAGVVPRTQFRARDWTTRRQLRGSTGACIPLEVGDLWHRCPHA